MVLKVINWFKIRPVDSIVLSVVILILLSIALASVFDVGNFYRTTSVGLSECLLGGFLGTLAGLSFIVGSPRHYRKFDRVFVLAGIVSSVVAFAWAGRLNGIWNVASTFGLERQFALKYLTGWQGLCWLLAFSVLAVFVFWISHWVTRRVVKLGRRLEITRVRFLILIAVVLFAGSVIKNSAEYFEVMLRREVRQWIWLLPVSCFAAGIAVCGICMCHCRNFWLRGMIALIFGTVMAALGYYAVTIADMDPIPAAFLMLFPIAFVVPLTLIRPINSAESSQRVGDENSNSPREEKQWGILWSGTAIIALLLGVFTVQQFDINTLLSRQANRWSVAHHMRKLKSEVASSVSAVCSDQFSYFSISFDKESSSDDLKKFESFPVAATFEMENLNSSIDCDLSLDVSPNFAILRNSEVSAKQLVDLNRAFPSMHVDNLKFDDSVEEASLNPGFSGWMIDGRHPGEIAFLLSRVNDFSGIGMLNIHSSTCNLDDWHQIVRASEQCQVLIAATQLPNEIIDSWRPAKGQSLANMKITCEDDQFEIARLLVLETDANVSPIKRLSEDGMENEFWAMALAAGHGLTEVERNYVQTQDGLIKDVENIRDRFESNGWIVASSKKSVESIYFPGVTQMMLEDAAHFTELKRLSLDNQWVHPASGVGIADDEFSSLRTLGKIAELEELYLPVGTKPVDLEFLGKLKELKHLQITPRRAMYDLPGFEQCQSLESLTLLNSPNEQVLGELKAIKSLRKLTIVDFLYRFSGPGADARLVAAFPNVDVTIVSPVNFRTKPTEEFLKHRDKVEKELRKAIADESN